MSAADARITDLKPDGDAAGLARVGSIISVTGSHALVLLDDTRAEVDRIHRPQLGAIMSIDAGPSIVLGLVSAMSVPAPSLDGAGGDMRIVEVELIGEFTK
ncbi:MAG: hypothetical protein RIE56_06875, partial [Amphiplicatus sp.]